MSVCAKCGTELRGFISDLCPKCAAPSPEPATGGRDYLTRIEELMPTECVCDEAYSGRNLVDPKCGYHEYGEEVLAIIAEARAPRAEPGGDANEYRERIHALSRETLVPAPSPGRKRRKWGRDGLWHTSDCSCAYCTPAPSPQPAGAEAEYWQALMDATIARNAGEPAQADAHLQRAWALRPAPAPAVEEALRELVESCPAPMLHDRYGKAYDRARALLTETREGQT
jgi:hypothetical protein